MHWFLAYVKPILETDYIQFVNPLTCTSGQGARVIGQHSAAEESCGDLEGWRGAEQTEGATRRNWSGEYERRKETITDQVHQIDQRGEMFNHTFSKETCCLGSVELVYEKRLKPFVMKCLWLERCFKSRIQWSSQKWYYVRPFCGVKRLTPQIGLPFLFTR